MKQVAVPQTLGLAKPEVEEIFARLLPGHVLRWVDEELSLGQSLSGLLNEAELLVTADLPVDARTIEASGLRMISVSFTGYNHIDLESCRRKGVAVTNVPGYSTNSVAELMVASAISLLRGVAGAGRMVREGRWDQAPPGSELWGKTAGIIGTGRIGARAAEIFSALGCRVLGYSRRENEAFIGAGGGYCQLGQLLRESDLVSLHLPYSPGVRHLIGRRELALMKPTAILLNYARGGLVDEQALADHLRSGQLAGAALDVFGAEPLPADSPLLSAPRLLLTPHIGYRTAEALRRKAESTFQNIADFERGLMTNRVDIV